MNYKALLPAFTMALTLHGCATQLSARSQGNATVTVHGDPRLAAATGLFATGVALAAEGAQAEPGAASVNVQGGVAVPGAPAAAVAPGAHTTVVATITGLTVHAAGQAATSQSITGGAVTIEHAGQLGTTTVAGGELVIDANAVEGAPIPVTGGTIVLAGGARYSIGGGRITIQRNLQGDGWMIAGGRITTTEATTTTATTTTTTTTTTANGGVATASGAGVGGAPGTGVVVATATPASSTTTTTTTTTASRTTTTRVTGVDVGRIGIGDGAQVIAGGEIAVTGLPPGEDLVVVDGSVQVEGMTSTETTAATTRTSASTGPAVILGTPTARVHATPRRTLRVRTGGTLLVSNRHGRRWRVRVEGGEIQAGTEGTNPGGRTVWTPASGEIRVSIVGTGDDTMALQGGDSLPEARVQLTPRVLHALDTLLAAVPQGTRESARMAAAVQVAIRTAESTEPAFYAISIRGRSLVLMVDMSYSMSDPDPVGAGLAATPSKLDVARAELVKVLASVPASVTVNVIAFSSRVHTLWSAPRAMDDNLLNEAIRWVAALRPQDETHPLEALQAAAAMQPDQIVLLSDGRPSDSEAVLQNVLASVERMSARSRVDVVGFGADQDRAFLTALASRGRGTLRLR